MLLHGIYCCGTIHTSRKYLPTDLKPDKQLERGDTDYRVSKQCIVFYKWKDNKSFLVVSNFHGTEIGKIKRTQKDETRKIFTCPKSIVCYNQNMGGVDKADYYCALYGIDRKNVKWWHQILFGLIDRTITNVYIAFSKVTGVKESSLLFRRNVTLALLTLGKPPKVVRPLSANASPLLSKKRRKEKFSTPDTVRKQNLGAHWPEFGDKRARCEVCS